MIIAAADQHCFRSRIESAKADLKRMFSVDVCHQMDILFAEVLHDLETQLSFSSGGSSGGSGDGPSSSLSSSQEEPNSFSEDSGPTDSNMANSYPSSSSSSSEEHEDVLPFPSVEEAPLLVEDSSAEQPVLSAILPPKVESALAICSGQESVKEEKKKEETKVETVESTVITNLPSSSSNLKEHKKCQEGLLKNFDDLQESHHDHEHQQDVEINEPACDQLTQLTNQSQSSSSKDNCKHQQFKKLHSESEEIVCPIVWCKHVTYKRHQFIFHFQVAHPEVSSLNCAICDTIMYRPWDMFMHELLYHLTGLFGCTAPDCPFVGRTRAAVLAHYDIVHLERGAPRRPRSLPVSLLTAPQQSSHYRARFGRYEQEDNDGGNGGPMYNNYNNSSSSSKALVSYVKRRTPINPMKVDQWRSKPNGGYSQQQQQRMPPPTAAHSMYAAAATTSSSVSYYNGDGSQTGSGRYMYSMPPPPLPPQAYKLSSYYSDQVYQRYQQQDRLPQLTNGGDGGGGGAYGGIAFQQQQQQQQLQPQQMYAPSQMMPTGIILPAS